MLNEMRLEKIAELEAKLRIFGDSLSGAEIDKINEEIKKLDEMCRSSDIIEFGL